MGLHLRCRGVQSRSTTQAPGRDWVMATVPDFAKALAVRGPHRRCRSRHNNRNKCRTTSDNTTYFFNGLLACHARHGRAPTPISLRCHRLVVAASPARFSLRVRLCAAFGVQAGQSGLGPTMAGHSFHSQKPKRVRQQRLENLRVVNDAAFATVMLQRHQLLIQVLMIFYAYC